MFIRHVQQFFFEPMLADHYSSITGSVLSDDSIMMSYIIHLTSTMRNKIMFIIIINSALANHCVDSLC